MKLLAFAAVALLSVIAYRIPSAIDIGRGVVRAQQEVVEARLEGARKDAEREEQARQEEMRRGAAADRERLRRQAQADFDNLPKWDRFGNPINRVPPTGLSETGVIPVNPVTPPPRTPTPEEKNADILRKYGNKPNP